MSYNNLDDEYLSITEFADYVGITPDSLRHYDNKGIFTPAKYGTEFRNKYRYYAPAQIMTVKMIRVLTEIGVSLDTIKKLAKDRNPEKIIQLFSKHRYRLADEIRFLQGVHSVISTYTELLYEAMSITESEITVLEMPDRRILLGDKTDFSGQTGYVKEFVRFCDAPHKPKLNLSYPIGGYFESMDEFLNEPSLPTRFFSLDPKGHERREAGLYLVGYTRGYYGDTGVLPGQMAAFAKKNKLIFDGPVYNIFLVDEISETDHERYLLQVSASVKDRRLIPRRLFRNNSNKADKF